MVTKKNNRCKIEVRGTNVERPSLIGTAGKFKGQIIKLSVRIRLTGILSDVKIQTVGYEKAGSRLLFLFEVFLPIRIILGSCPVYTKGCTRNLINKMKFNEDKSNSDTSNFMRG